MRTEIRQFVTPGNLVWLAGILATAKILHELGHALTCIRLGGQCRELGLMLLVFTPCLYCDVSDAWTFSNKWRRIAVSAAGIIVEINLAAVAALLWCFSPIGLVHALAFNVMVVCSVSTLLFNGNPLMRYDGYYVLADLVEVPNLAEQSRAVLARAAAFLFLGIRQPRDSVSRRGEARGQLLLGLYGLASSAYRGFAVPRHSLDRPSTVRCLGYCCDRRWRCGHRIGWHLAAAGLAMCRVLQLSIVDATHIAVACAGIRRLLGSGACLYCPRAVAVPCYIALGHRAGKCPFGLCSRGRHVGKLGSRGRSSRKRPGNLAVGQFGYPPRRCGTDGQTGSAIPVRGDSPRTAVARSGGSAALIPTAEAALADLDDRLRQRQLDEQSLILRAGGRNRSAARQRSGRGAPSSGQLPAWSGSPLEPQNRGCQIEPGTLVCMIASARPVEAFVMVDQDSVALIQVGQLAHVRIDSLPGQVYEGRVVEIASRDEKVVPRELASLGELPHQVDRQGIDRPVSVTYQVRVQLTRQPEIIVPGSRGEAKFFVEPQSLFCALSALFDRTSRYAGRDLAGSDFPIHNAQ